jgi:hypothetical protein
MIPLNLPPCDIKLKRNEDGKLVIFDILRRKWFQLTPEEWVRQNFIHFLIEKKHYPAGLLANEVGININGTTRRCDTVLYDKIGMRPRLILEYKAPHVKITQEVFFQIASYNSLLRADYLIVSNGFHHYCCKINYEQNSYKFLQNIPNFEELD